MKPRSAQHCTRAADTGCTPAQIVQFYGAVIESGKLLLIMELLMRGSLFDVISRDTEGQVTWYSRCATLLMQKTIKLAGSRLSRVISTLLSVDDLQVAQSCLSESAQCHRVDTVRHHIHCTGSHIVWRQTAPHTCVCSQSKSDSD